MANPIKSAILSVSDKSGICEFGHHLAQMGVVIYSTGGTFRALTEAGVKAVPIDELTQFPEMMDGRVKTLHPAVFAGILARRANVRDMETLAAHQLRTIDLVAVNLYPFKKVVAQPDAAENDIIENIDIGGPSMLRASAKSFRDVVAVVDPTDYGTLIEEMLGAQGEVSLETRRRFALKVFRHTADYDTAISEYFARTTPAAK
jgi:phosphoribosylaminoimidazolecarboxamide formyltransferase/IMP cyclohydrolase